MTMTSIDILLLCLQLASAATSSSQSLTAPAARLAFYPRRRGGSVTTTRSPSSTIFAHKKYTHSKPSTVQTTGFRRKSTKTTKQKTLDLDDFDNYDYNLQQSTRGGGASSAVVTSDEPSLEELRSQLGPIGTFVSDTIELTVVTIGSYISGGFLGYFGGSLMNSPSLLFGKDLGGITSRFSALHTKAFASCKSWAQLSAAFTGFNNLVRLVRGSNAEDDGWNAVLGSALTGAYLNRAQGAQAMVQGGATYAGFTYFLEKFASPGSKKGRTQQSQELMYTDVPVVGDTWE